MTEHADDHGIEFERVLSDYLSRIDAGEVVDKAAFVLSHPEFADELAEFFSQERVANQLAGHETLRHDHLATHDNSIQVRCPKCRSTAALPVDAPLNELICPTCGGEFSLATETAPSHAAATISRLGHFELIERLGMGGFGTVWKARDTELDRIVAIKTPRAGRIGEGETEKFLREARAAAQLRHQNIVGVHEVGRVGDTAYIVSDLIRGVSLADWLTGERPTERKSAQLCAKVADALHYAHEQGVIHRDVKPSNIMIDDRGEPHLMDFGLARRELGEVTITVDGAAMGTPGYMSPEQARGCAHQADRRTDVYSVGVMLFELLTGELPFRGNQNMLVHQVLHVEPPSPRKLNRNISRDLETITLKCLEKEPGRRYLTAGDVARDLKCYLESLPITARRVSRAHRALRWCQRNKLISAIAIFFVVLFAAVAILIPILRNRYARAMDYSNIFLQAERARAEAEQSSITQLVELTIRREPDADPTELKAIGELLRVRTHFWKVKQQLWTYLEHQAETEHVAQYDLHQLRAAGLLANSAFDDKRWNTCASRVAWLLIERDSQDIEAWIAVLEPISRFLLDPLSDIYLDQCTGRKSSKTDRKVALDLLAVYAADQHAFLIDTMLDSTHWHVHSLVDPLIPHKEAVVPVLYAELERGFAVASAESDRELEFKKNQFASRKANAACLLMLFGEVDAFADKLVHSTNPRVRSYIIQRLHKFLKHPAVLIEQLASERRSDVLSALIMCLGEFSEEQVSEAERSNFVSRIISIYFNAPSAEVHAAFEWLLAKWGKEEVIRSNLRKLDAEKVQERKNWYLTKTGEVTMVIPPTRIVAKGSNRLEREIRNAPRRFAIASKPITESLYREFAAENGEQFSFHLSYNPRSLRHPKVKLDWFDAAAFCRWLSEKEGIPREEMCYPEIQRIKDPMQMPKNYLSRTGYRLPTAREWVYACRAGTETPFFFGYPDTRKSPDELLDNYVWHLQNSKSQCHPAGMLKPNQFGLFGMLGNVTDWTQESDEFLKNRRNLEDTEDLLTIDGKARIRRGFSFAYPPENDWGAGEIPTPPTFRSVDSGFRIVRTITEQ